MDSILTKEELEECHALGLKVVTWCYPKAPDLGQTFDSSLNRTLIEWGVDGIIVDDPGHLNSILAAKGLQVARSY